MRGDRRTDPRRRRGSKRELMTYWALGSRGMVGVEYLTNVGSNAARGGFSSSPP